MQKNVYYIANARIPTERAHGIQLAKMAEALVLSGIPLVLVVPNRPAPHQSVKEYYHLAVDIPVVRIPVFPLYGYGSWGFRLASLSFGVNSALYMLWQKWRRRISLVYTIDMDQFSFFALPFLGVHYIAEIHDAKPYNWTYALFFRNMHTVVTINRLIKDRLVQVFGISPEKIIVAPNGIDLDLFGRIEKSAARQSLLLPAEEKLCIYSGKFYDWKGLEIFSRVVDHLPKDTRLVFVGGTKEEFERVSGVPAPRGALFFGHRPHVEMPAWISAADCVTVLGTKQHQYSFYYTSPMKLFEYMAIGTPIVAAASPAVRDVVSEKEVYLYEPDDALSLAEAIVMATGTDPFRFDKEDACHRLVSNLTWSKRAARVSQRISVCE